MLVGMQFKFRHLVLSPFLIVAPYRFLYVLSEAVRARTTSTDGYYLVYATLECSIVRILCALVHRLPQS